MPFMDTRKNLHGMGDNKFNLGLAHQEYLQQLLSTSTKGLLERDLYTRARSLISAWVAIDSELGGTDKTLIHTQAAYILKLLNNYEEYLAMGLLKWDGMSYVIGSGIDDAHLKSINSSHNQLTNSCYALEILMRKKLSPILFPKDLSPLGAAED